MSTDQRLKGIVLAFASLAAFSFSDASIKLIEGALSPFETAFFGAAFGLMAMPFLLKPGDRWSDVLRSTNRPLWLIRFFAASLSAIGSVVAFTHLSMAEAFALIFLLPSFVTIMSVVFLKEVVGIRRWLAVLVGFIGVLVVMRPGFRELSIGHVAAIISGFGGAVSIVIFRAMGPKEKHISLYGAGVFGWGSISAIFMISDFAWPMAEQWMYLAGFGLLAALGNVLMMRAATFVEAGLIGSIQYSQMLWAILLGYLVFGDGVDLPTWIGIVLIVGSGLLTLMRERKRGTPLPPPIAGDVQAAVAVTPEEKR